MKVPKIDDKKEVCAQECKKKAKPPVDEATKKRLAKMCAKPGRGKKTMVCNKSPCDKKDKKALERAEREKLEKAAREKAYADLKHTDWKAVPIKGTSSTQGGDTQLFQLICSLLTQT